MPNDERLETLNDLKTAKEAANAELEKLPVVAHSGKMERHKKEIEDKITRLDKAIETFSKQTVYVAMWCSPKQAWWLRIENKKEKWLEISDMILIQ